MITYQDGTTLLSRTLEALDRVCDRIVVVDGAFAEFPHENTQSDARHQELFSRFAGIIISMKEPCTEIEKRNQYLIGSEGDWYLVVDSDEEVVGNLNGYKSSSGWHVVIKQGWLAPRTEFRLFPHFAGVHYEHTHNAVCNSAGEPLNNLNLQAFPSMYLQHHTWTRSLKRVRAKGMYLEHLAEIEREARAELCL